MTVRRHDPPVRLPHPRAGSLGRFLLAGLGIAGLVLGAILAWRARSATPLLIISGVLVALGLLDWTEFRVSHGDTSAAVTRNAAARIEEVAEREDIPEPAREELRDLAEELTAASESPTGGVFTADHHYLSDNQLVLSVQSRGIHITAPRCEVELPDGRTLRSFGRGRTRPNLGLYWQTIYPRFFEGDDLTRPGRYRVTWYIRGTDEILAFDDFVLPYPDADPGHPEGPGEPGPTG
jgi:hypothetical protein